MKSQPGGKNTDQQGGAAGQPGAGDEVHGVGDPVLDVIKQMETGLTGLRRVHEETRRLEEQMSQRRREMGRWKTGYARRSGSTR